MAAGVSLVTDFVLTLLAAASAGVTFDGVFEDAAETELVGSLGLSAAWLLQAAKLKAIELIKRIRSKRSPS